MIKVDVIELAASLCAFERSDIGNPTAKEVLLLLLERIYGDLLSDGECRLEID